MSLALLVNRDYSQPNCIRSHWLVDGQPECVGLELPLTPLVADGLCAIPAGQYQVEYTLSERFSTLAGHAIWLPVVLDLPGCSTPTLFHGKPIDDCGIRIHGGNVVNSIPYGQPGGPEFRTYSINDPKRTDSEGCLLVGTAFGSDDKSLVESQAALQPLITKIANACDNKILITLTITKPPTA